MNESKSYTWKAPDKKVSQLSDKDEKSMNYEKYESRDKSFKTRI